MEAWSSLPHPVELGPWHSHCSFLSRPVRSTTWKFPSGEMLGPLALALQPPLWNLGLSRIYQDADMLGPSNVAEAWVLAFAWQLLVNFRALPDVKICRWPVPSAGMLSHFGPWFGADEGTLGPPALPEVLIKVSSVFWPSLSHHLEFCTSHLVGICP